MDKLVLGLKVPKGKKSVFKQLERMKALSRCQGNFMKAIFSKIDRKSKPIKKYEKMVSENLKRKRVFLLEEDFDILGVLNQANGNALIIEEPLASPL
jgi:hypothetical protein